jgi:hypothetical protein
MKANVLYRMLTNVSGKGKSVTLKAQPENERAIWGAKSVVIIIIVIRT